MFRFQRFVFLCVVLIWAENTVEGNTYEERVDEVFKKLNSFHPHFHCCLQIANEKSQEFANVKTTDEIKAIAIANLYSQNCPHSNKFYATLNSYLRNGNPPEPWNTTSHLLIEAIEKLGLENFSVVYRGQTALYETLNQNTIAVFSQFTSSSKSAEQALEFAKVSYNTRPKYFFEIQNVSGLNLERYAAIPAEKEVLLKPNSSFMVLNVSKDASFNADKWKQLNLPSPVPEVYIILKMVSPGRRRRSNEVTSITFFHFENEYSHRHKRSTDECQMYTSGAPHHASMVSLLLVFLVMTGIYYVQALTDDQKRD